MQRIIFSLLNLYLAGRLDAANISVIQVFVLILGGFVTTYIALNIISDGEGIFAGLTTIYNEAPGHFAMILDKDHLLFQLQCISKSAQKAGSIV